jgi:ribosome-associated translation inhibitor RaiA
MQVLVNSDHHITGSESVTQRVEAILDAAIGHLAERITRVEVHLNDVNAGKHGDRDKRCMMEARVGGLAPIVVTNEAPSVLEAIEGSATKLEHALRHALERMAEGRGRGPREEEIASTDLLDQLEKSGGRPSGDSR